MINNEDQMIETIRCIKSPAYCLDKFVWMDADDGIIPFNIGNTPKEDFYYQREILNHLVAGENVVILKSRRVGLSWIAAFYTWWGINFHRGWNALLVSRTEKEAVSLLKKVKFIHNNLAYKNDEDITKATPATFLQNMVEYSSQSMFGIGHRNDQGIVSSVSSATSYTTTKHTGRGEKAKFVFVDEVQFIEEQEEVFGSALTTAARAGQYMMGCVTEDTIIFTENGVETIGDYVANGSPKGFSDIVPVNVLGKDGLKTATKVFNNGFGDTLKIKTTHNYELECSLIHPIYVYREGHLQWIKAEDISVGDVLPISRGMNVWGNSVDISDCIWKPEKDLWRYKLIDLPTELTPDLAYLLGLIVGDGYIGKKSVDIATTDKETEAWLAKSPFGLSFNKSQINFRASSKQFVKFCEAFGMPIGVKAPYKYIPKRIMKAPKDIVVAFLQGLFDTDGHSEVNGRVGFTSTSERLVNEVRMLLLNAGIVCSKYNHTTSERNIDGRKIKACKAFRLNITSDATKFFDTVGFRLSRKQGNRKENSVNLNDSLPVEYGLIKDIRDNLQYGENTTIKTRMRNNATKQKNSGFVSYYFAHAILEELSQLENLSSYRTLKEQVEKNYLWVTVTEIAPHENYTVDFNIPEGHNYIGNGLILHNSNAGDAGTRFYHMCMQGRAGDNKTYWYREVWPWEAAIDEATIDRASEALPEDIKKQEWYLVFKQSGNAVFNETHLAACYKPMDMFPEIKHKVESYKKEVEEGFRWYYSGVDSAVGKVHRKSKIKDFNCFTSLTMDGIQAFCYTDKKPLSEWAGADIKNADGVLVPTVGTVSRLHKEWPGVAAIEENGPGYTVISRHHLPPDGLSDRRIITMSQPVKSRIIKNLIIAVESHMIVITDELTYQHMSRYQYGEKPDTYEAPMGEHDDCVMALAMAWDTLLAEGGIELRLPDGKTIDDLRPAATEYDPEIAGIAPVIKNKLPRGMRASAFMPRPYDTTDRRAKKR